jgi:serine/threonine protein kinase
VQPPLVQPLRRWDPEQVGGYVLLGRLGAGAMGQVYLGRSPAGRLVAVKTIKTELAEEPDFRSRFGQEVAAARRVSGAFTAAVVAADSEADVPWLATVYVPAPSLSSLVRTCGPLGVAAVRWLAAGCAEALESIHGVGLVHRDLKPANVLVSPDGPRVIDFGVARAAERIQLTVTRGSVGTPAYMAPEQARDTRQATSASDIFSLGATMLFAATGHAPYRGETVVDVLVRLATEPPDLTGLPAELAEIVGACLERDPRGRPTSASVVARLAPGLAANGELGTAPLPAAAFTLIDEYRRIPRTSPARETPPSLADDSVSLPSGAGSPAGASIGVRTGTGSLSPVTAAGEDETLGSHPVLRRPAPPLAAPRDAAPPDAAPPDTAQPDLAHVGRLRPGRRVALAAGSALAAAALVAAGWGIGTAAGRHPPAGPSTGTSAGSSTGTSAGSSTGTSAGVGTSTSAGGGSSPSAATGTQASLGPVLPPPGGPGQGPPDVLNPAVVNSGAPFIALNQDFGDMNTGFVVHGQSWPANRPVTLALVGVGAPVQVVTDKAGTFNYVINQEHEFFAGRLPPGIYTVRVTDSAGKSATARFRVSGG